MTKPNERQPSQESIERRAGQSFELRQEGEEGGIQSVRVVGHAAVFGQEIRIGNFFRERIEPGAFARAIREDDVPFLIEHDDLPLARTSAGTLSLAEDQTGLRIESTLDSHDPDVMRIVPKMRRGDLSKMSFAFRPIREEWIDDDDDIPLRILHEVRLFDVSIVTNPAYEGTDIALRSLEAWKNQQARKKNFSAMMFRQRLIKLHDLRDRGGALMRSVFRLTSRR